MSLKEKLLKNSTKKVQTLDKSTVFQSQDQIPTMVPVLNIALSGSINGGLKSGITGIAGKSRHFKSGLTLFMVSAYLKKYPEAMCIFYDCEFGISKDTMVAFGVETSRVIHTPVNTLERLRSDMVNQLNGIERGDKVIIMIDSVGNMASAKEVNDAMDEKQSADLTRAKVAKSFWRIVTPMIRERDIPTIAIHHTYDTMETYSQQKISGGEGGLLSADTMFIIGRQQEKNGKELEGYTFVINVEKSRYVKEKSKLPFTVKFDGGIERYSGLLDIALETGHVVAPKQGWYSRPCVVDDKGWRRKDTNSSKFWKEVFTNTDFEQAIKNKFALSQGAILQDEDGVESVDMETGEILEEV